MNAQRHTTERAYGSSSNRMCAHPSGTKTQRRTRLGRGHAGSGSTAMYGNVALPPNLKWIWPLRDDRSTEELDCSSSSGVIDRRYPSANENPGSASFPRSQGYWPPGMLVARDAGRQGCWSPGGQSPGVPIVRCARVPQKRGELESRAIQLMQKKWKGQKPLTHDSMEELARFRDTHDLTDSEDDLEQGVTPVFVRGGRASMSIGLEPAEAQRLR